MHIRCLESWASGTAGGRCDGERSPRIATGDSNCLEPSAAVRFNSVLNQGDGVLWIVQLNVSSSESHWTLGICGGDVRHVNHLRMMGRLLDCCPLLQTRSSSLESTIAFSMPVYRAVKSLKTHCGALMVDALCLEHNAGRMRQCQDMRAKTS
jgi:hypothetical protein